MFTFHISDKSFLLRGGGGGNNGTRKRCAKRKQLGTLRKFCYKIRVHATGRSIWAPGSSGKHGPASASPFSRLSDCRPRDASVQRLLPRVGVLLSQLQQFLRGTRLLRGLLFQLRRQLGLWRLLLPLGLWQLGKEKLLSFWLR